MLRFPAEVVARVRPFYEGRSVCVTGGAGFIGGHLVDALLALGASVTVLDDLSNSSLSHLSGLMELDSERVQFVHGSILDDAALREAISLHGGARTIFHLAALGSVPRSVRYPERTFEVNAVGTLRVLEAARAARVQRMVYASSSSVYGDGALQPKHEGMLPSPASPYGAAKLAGEHLCATWARTYGLSTVSLRYFNVFGPRQRHDSAYAAVVPVFVRRLLAGERPVIFGDGMQTRDFTFVGNTVLGTLLAGAAERALAGEAFNIATASRTSLLELTERLSAIVHDPGSGGSHTGPLKPEVKAEFKPARPGEVLHSQADIGRAEEALGYLPVVDLESGLTQTVRYYRELAEWKAGGPAEGH